MSLIDPYILIHPSPYKKLNTYSANKAVNSLKIMSVYMY